MAHTNHARAQDSSSRPPTPPLRVLLADDNPKFLAQAILFLQKQAHLRIAGSVGDSDAALARALELRPDVLLLDLRMPGTPWLEMIPRLRAHVPQTRIVVLTLMDDVVFEQAAKARGAHAFVSKARLTQDLVPAIWRACRRGKEAQQQ